MPVNRPIHFSVVIPAYNVETYLAETLDSVLAQTYPHFDVAIVDDGSIDRTLAIGQEYAQRDRRIRVITQPNQGVSVARNRGIQETRGELVAFLDADDRWRPQKLEAHLAHFMVSGLASGTLGMSFATVAFMTPTGALTGQYSRSKLTQLQPEDFYIENQAITPSNVVIRRSVLESVGDFQLALHGSEDQELFFRIRWAGISVEGLAQVLTDYRIAADGISANLDKMEADWQQLNHTIALYAPELVDRHHDRAQAYFLRYLARRGIRTGGEPALARGFILRSIQQDWRLLWTEPKRTLSTLVFAYFPALSDQF
jgi:glycosyltransferase involved in cell wall biosynthesis